VVQSAVESRHAQYALRDSLVAREVQAEALRKSEEALRQADRMKDEFIATLAHELRNPLAPIRTGLQIVHRDPSGESSARALAMMERQVTYMVRLIDDLLDVSRISRGRLELQKEEVPLAAVIDRALESTKPYVEAAKHTLTVSLPRDNVILHADPMRLAQLISNLLTNAAKYTPNEGTITITARCVSGIVTIDVIDSGIGIAPEMLPRVFDMFSQVTSSIGKSQGGLGIGLALSRRLAELHGGTLEASSAGLGRGSTFTVTLPVNGRVG
jgi:signal transduction histidine kinase